ncbi:hypothetical protein GCM10007972_20480 [Iodidimonas muriae]|uniref:DUF3089 domain-containing protein n=1 Tax=Iodidimonas muriae TaxID=261467 RepID=A0ABQ2LEX2_9PROT|nr:DUF3089 domain-containing protein [Iodidimonas muriae]GER07580.1 hypothetical protein JCM17843_18900 [Kordiimonadales bacterium JCM 17843]GGO13862.1 hypothetical protein GCM10007972_20480 [Iodidimonas muriae]
MARLFLYIVSGLMGLTILGGALLYVFWDEAQMVALAQMKPETSLADAPKAPAPDYAKSESWAARPGADDNARVTPQGVEPLSPMEADVFFIHPTSYLGTSYWNAPIDEPQATASLPSILKAQASPFAASARIFAPRYRQASFGAFLAANSDTVATLMLAYSDVEAAFDHYLREDNKGRPFILAGHSQGALLGSFLLKNRINGTDLADRMVAAYLPGWTFSSVQDLGALPDIGACETALDTGCMISWQTFGEEGDPSYLVDAYNQQFGLSGLMKAGTPMLCQNPVSWERDGTAPASRHMGAVPPAPTPDATLPAPINPGLESRCGDDGFLYITPAPGEPFTRFLLPGQNYHVYDIHLFSMNVRANVRDRIAAWYESHPSAALDAAR